MPPVEDVTFPMVMSPETVTPSACVGGGLVDAKVAVTLLAAFMTIRQVEPVPLQLPDHPVKVPFAAAVAVKLTNVFNGVLAEQLVAP